MSESWIWGFGALALFSIAFIYFLLSLLIIIPTWRVFRRAGFSGALSLLHLVPGIGMLVVMAILAFSTWPAGEARRKGS
jgi:uncharacterized membrane protein YhaH (DUF805 family)